jgi:hypothetical protein
MKAEMTADGKIVLKPESGIEAFALMRWIERTIVNQPDVQRKEAFHWRGSSIQIDLSAFPETLRVDVPADFAEAWMEAKP